MIVIVSFDFGCLANVSPATVGPHHLKFDALSLMAQLENRPDRGPRIVNFFQGPSTGTNYKSQRVKQQWFK
jgi:hypothetical protein